MRVRYEHVGRGGYQAECDLTEKKAKKRFEELKKDGLCEWVELVGEDDGDYMKVLDYYDKTELARRFYCIMHELFG